MGCVGSCGCFFFFSCSIESIEGVGREGAGRARVERVRLRELELTCVLRSIREFCELDVPIWLFDKDGSFQVVRLGQVCFRELVEERQMLTFRVVL